MAVTNYYSFGGEILGEETGGVRRDYLTDALGSVTATVTEAGTVENTYRYKPYGEQLAMTGTGSDPKFLWVGQHGYRFELGSSFFYVRNRYYNPDNGTWNSKDKMPLTFSDIYIYCNSNPTVIIDYFGLQPNQIDSGKFGPGPPPSTAIYDCAKRLYKGTTGCDQKYGWWILICPASILKTKCPAFGCVYKHEFEHKKFISQCCANYTKCKGSECKTQWDFWFNALRSKSECKAYDAGNRCIKEVIGKYPDCNFCWEDELEKSIKIQKKCCDDYLKNKDMMDKMVCPFDSFGKIKKPLQKPLNPPIICDLMEEDKNRRIF